MKNRYLVVLLLILSLCFAACSKDVSLRLGTGGTGGTYYSFGNSLQQLASQSYSLNLEVKPTAGSAANLRLIDGGFLNLAIVQSDSLYRADQDMMSFAAVAGLYTEACQIVVLKNSSIETIYDLIGKKVSVGEQESGVLKNAQEILLAHGISIEMIEPVYISFSESAAMLEKGEIDCFFCTASAPVKAVTALSEQIPIRLLSIPQEIQKNMLSIYNGYISCTVPKGTYTGQDYDIYTLGVKAVLLARTDVKKEDVSNITGLLFKYADILSNATGIKVLSDKEYATEDIPVPFHTGAAEYYRSLGIKVDAYTGQAQKKMIKVQE